MRSRSPTNFLLSRAAGTRPFIGIGGAGLSAIARIMSPPAGVSVTGSGRQRHPFLVPLRELRVCCHRVTQPSTGGRHRRGHDGGPRGQPRGARSSAARAAHPATFCLPESVMQGNRVLAVVKARTARPRPRRCSRWRFATAGGPTLRRGGVLTATGRNADAGWGIRRGGRRERWGVPGLIALRGPVTNVEVDHPSTCGVRPRPTSRHRPVPRPPRPGGLPGVLRGRPGAARLAEVARTRGCGSSAWESASADPGQRGPAGRRQLPGHGLT